MEKETIDELEVFVKLDEKFTMINQHYMDFKKELEELIAKYRI